VQPHGGARLVQYQQGFVVRREGRLASKARKRIELMLAPPSKLGSVELPNSVAPPTATEHAMIEAAIQLDLITPEQAKALVEKGKTLGEWLMEQRRAKRARPGKSDKRCWIEWDCSPCSYSTSQCWPVSDGSYSGS
jgi:hypothetical protein